ncbi:hypothetical protein MES5069_220166 [Mesorhizobium escarrei]|uniref:Uncharacterized protein n=1 Tax=Mesorhizobium escarrei TaxID=666018 RepID=A0ABN8JS15_9HYPH|nr:hypothetical protein MES5069_220166 [Mesorhizobium escarrei]
MECSESPASGRLIRWIGPLRLPWWTVARLKGPNYPNHPLSTQEIGVAGRDLHKSGDTLARSFRHAKWEGRIS